MRTLSSHNRNRGKCPKRAEPKPKSGKPATVAALKLHNSPSSRYEYNLIRQNKRCVAASSNGENLRTYLVTSVIPNGHGDARRCWGQVCKSYTHHEASSVVVGQHNRWSKSCFQSDGTFGDRAV